MKFDEGKLHEFTSRLEGRLLRPEDAEYEDARKIWNTMIDRRTALIARCAGATDVVHAVRFARENNLPAAVFRRLGSDQQRRVFCREN